MIKWLPGLFISLMLISLTLGGIQNAQAGTPSDHSHQRPAHKHSSAVKASHRTKAKVSQHASKRHRPKPADKHPAASKHNTHTASPAPSYRNRSDVKIFAAELAAHSELDKNAIEQALSEAQYQAAILPLVVPPTSATPSVRRDWPRYRARFVTSQRIDQGVDFWQNNARLLAQAEHDYGVPAEIIVAILGVETVYGRNTGNFRVLDTLATLAFDYPANGKPGRQAYFREQLGEFLMLSRQLGLAPTALKGSYAGAIGLPQFMPGSYRQYGVDFDQNGDIDLRNSAADAIGSIGYFLMAHGWIRDQPPVVSAQLPANIDQLVDGGLEPTLSWDTLQSKGVTSEVTDRARYRYGVIDLGNADGPADHVLGTSNFFVITRYNRSYFYAMSVVDLAQALRRGYGGSTSGSAPAANARLAAPMPSLDLNPGNSIKPGGNVIDKPPALPTRGLNSGN